MLHKSADNFPRYCAAENIPIPFIHYMSTTQKNIEFLIVCDMCYDGVPHSSIQYGTGMFRIEENSRADYAGAQEGT